MADLFAWMPWRRERRAAEARRQRDLVTIAVECERLAALANEPSARLGYQRAAEVARELAAAPAIGEGGIAIVAARLPSDVARADEQATVRELIDARRALESPGVDRAVAVAAVITGIAAVAIGSSLGWAYGRVAFGVGAAIAVVVIGGWFRRSDR